LSSPNRRIPITKVLGPTPEGSFTEYTVVGVYSADNDNDFVQHVGMLASETDVSENAEVPVLHMGPPIVAGTESAAKAPKKAQAVRVHLVGDLALTIAERNAMKTWCAKVDKQRRPKPMFQQYVVHPPMKWERSEIDRRLFQRFSCVGFVMECYIAAGIDLLDSEAELPAVDKQILQSAYPNIVKVEGMEKKVQDQLGFKGREDLGIPGNGPWKIVMAGYLFHSLHRASADVPRPEPFSPTSISAAYYP